MGLLVNGEWRDKWYDTSAEGGRFKRQDSRFRNWIGRDEPLPAESGRYHLYVSMACPWAHRTLIFRQLKSLQDHISVSVVHPNMLSNGWEFRQDDEAFQDDLFQLNYLYQLYLKADPNYEGRVTVPVLWDKKLGTIVNNESSEIIRMFNTSFNHLTGNDLDFYPPDLQEQINRINERIYHTVNNGVYRCGFATTQSAYEEAFDELFDTLEWIDTLLSKQTYLLGERVTEADWRLFTTLVRFDSVYHGHFKTNKKRIMDYEHIWDYVKCLYQYPGVAQTVNMDQIKRHYYFSHTMINPTQVIPKGPEIPFFDPHHR